MSNLTVQSLRRGFICGRPARLLEMSAF